jgi:hypothetical protein
MQFQLNTSLLATWIFILNGVIMCLLAEDEKPEMTLTEKVIKTELLLLELMNRYGNYLYVRGEILLW